MNDLEIINRNGKLYVDSRNVAEMIGKDHAMLMRDVRKYVEILTNAKLQALDFFVKSSYRDSKGENRPCYLLTRKGCDMVANKMTGEKGILFTAKYVTMFEAMEKQLAFSMLPDFTDPVVAARAWADAKESERKVILELEAAKPKLKYLDQILNSSGLLNVTQIAKAYGLTAQALNEILHNEKRQYKSNGTWVLCSKYQNSGYMVQKTIQRSNNKFIQYSYWTQRGRMKINDILVTKGYIAAGEATLFA